MNSVSIAGIAIAAGKLASPIRIDPHAIHAIRFETRWLRMLRTFRERDSIEVAILRAE